MVLPSDDLTKLIVFTQNFILIILTEFDLQRLGLIADLFGSKSKFAVFVISECPKLAILCDAHSVKRSAAHPYDLFFTQVNHQGRVDFFNLIASTKPAIKTIAPGIQLFTISNSC
jgi:hypothetical protein